VSNQIQAIRPYWKQSIQTWVFDDERAGLVEEPFVSGADTFLTYLSKDVPDALKGFRLLFSSAPFPGYQHQLNWSRQEMGGNWYRSEQPAMEGWLCPALFKYFDRAPPVLYVRADPLPTNLQP
jgi:hypothetical protein